MVFVSQSRLSTNDLFYITIFITCLIKCHKVRNRRHSTHERAQSGTYFHSRAVSRRPSLDESLCLVNKLYVITGVRVILVAVSR